MKIICLFIALARTKAPLKPAQSRRFRDFPGWFLF